MSEWFQNAKFILVEDQYWEGSQLSQGYLSEINVIVTLGFELNYYDVTLAIMLRYTNSQP